MRPVRRGEHPVGKEGTPLAIREYQDAREPLIQRLGKYCSYCEMPLDNSPAVEHVRPKSLHPKLERCWDNFLLACAYCNATKGSKDVELDSCFWPDKDNTFQVFTYYESGGVEVAEELDSDNEEKAQLTLNLTGFGTESDSRRSVGRRDACGLAHKALTNLSRLDREELREQIIDTATSRGYWSVWMTVFADDADMRQRLVMKFTGTNREFVY